ncbi:MAG: transketolase [Candidatus Vogelbacteria bacterium RIFOXYD1_FULL_46_19]|uniref:Transketolase n=1 Tax=Candidatus Vogelbacteria bacterium RIFOXYD1_FULL_46_19 TaxID=1802439 RepID=A0A1G2QGF3_9BACT|nr:MAG: transketolase [Candidatus Vogelbacteria bacterium RIFOXYD1_FULL_46_19]
MEQEAIRDGFGRGLVTAGETNEQVVALCADLTESTRIEAFAKKFPDRFIQVGVAEQNLVTVASGLATMGKIPFAASYAMFSPGRNWEQIRTTICYNNVPVKIVGAHAGVSVGPDGGTHQAIEDMALMRVLPRMTVVVPADSLEAEKATLALADSGGPAYIRLARNKSAVITTEASPFELGRAEVLFDSDEPAALIIACGQMVYFSLLAAKKLEAEGVAVSVINLHTIKPLDKATVIKYARQAGAVVTVEEHQVAGGMGGAVAEMLAAEAPVPVEFLGIQDQFGQSGEPGELLEHYSLGVKDIIMAVKKVIERKNV